MHIKTGTWESNNAACETDALCDPAVLVSSTAAATTTNSEPHIRNRRLSPGSGNGGGGGGCTAGVDQQQQTRRVSPAGTPEGNHQPSGPGHHTSSHHPFAFRGEKDQRRGQQQRRGGQRREAQRGPGGAGGRTTANDRSQKLHQKERWVGDSLSLLKPPPAFPVQDSPAKLQPAVSYASKVKSGATGGALEEDPPAIGVLLQNQWGLSFISEARPPAEGGRVTAPCPSVASAAVTPLPPPPPTTDATESTSPPPPQQGTCCAAEPLDEATVVPAAATSPVTLSQCPEVDDSNGKLLLSCRHLVEALKYHTREWNAVCNKQKDPKNKVVWYKDPLEQPA